MYYYVPQGTEDTLFGSGVTLNVSIQWDGSTASFYLNGRLVKSTPYVPAASNWTAASNFDLGSYEYLTYGGYDSLDDIIGNFSVTSQGLSSLSCNPTSVAPAGSAACTVTLNLPAGSGGAVVALASDSSSLVAPATVAIPAGADSASFTANAGSFLSDQTANLTANFNGSSAQAAVALVTPPLVSSLECAASTLTQNGSTSCTITLSKSTSIATTVGVSNTVAGLTVPASVTVPASATSAIFTITGTTVTADQTGTLTAALNGSSAQVSITVLAYKPISSLKCAVSSLSPNTSTLCTAILAAAAPAGGSTLQVSSNSPVLTVHSSLSVPAGALSASFAAVAGSFTTNQTAQVSATLGSAAASASISLVTAALTTKLSILGDSTELNGTGNGTVVTPALAPSGLTGKVVGNGSGSVNLVAGSGVYFLACCSNTNNAYYKFTGAALGNVFNTGQGQIAFTLQSRYSFAQRQATASGMRYAFDARDANGHQYYFLTQIFSSSLVFSYMVGGTSMYYYVPKGTEDALYGNGVALNVAIKWDGANGSLYLNGKLVKTTPYVPAASNWSSASNFDLGAYEYQTFGGYNVSEDLISNFAVASSSTTSTQGLTAMLVKAPQQSAAADQSRRPRPAALAGGGHALSCDASPVAAGSSVVCEVRLDSAVVSDTGMVSLTSSSEHVKVPATLTGRAGQNRLPFAVLTDADAPEGTVTLEARSGADAIQGSLNVVRPEAPMLRIPENQVGTPGTPLRFGIATDDRETHPLSASGLPSGATFDAVTGSFAWVPTAQDLGHHTISFTAADSRGLSTTKTVEVNVVNEPAGTAPQILAVGDGDQAFATRARSDVLAAIPSVRFDGQPAQAGDLLSIFVAGLNCNQNPANRDFQLKLGAAYSTIASIQPADGTPGVCQVTFEVPSGAAGTRTPLSIDVAGRDGRVVSSNTVSIAVED